MKWVLAVFPVIGFMGAAFVALLLKEKGYHQKGADVVLWTVVGILGWAAVIYVFTN